MFGMVLERVKGFGDVLSRLLQSISEDIQIEYVDHEGQKYFILRWAAKVGKLMACPSRMH